LKFLRGLVSDVVIVMWTLRRDFFGDDGRDARKSWDVEAGRRFVVNVILHLLEEG